MSDLNRENLVTVLNHIVDQSGDDKIRDDVRAVIAALQGTGVVFVNPPLLPDAGPIAG